MPICAFQRWQEWAKNHAARGKQAPPCVYRKIWPLYLTAPPADAGRRAKENGKLKPHPITGAYPAAGPGWPGEMKRVFQRLLHRLAGIDTRGPIVPCKEWDLPVRRVRRPAVPDLHLMKGLL